MNWQPIETAPKQKEVLIFVPHYCGHDTEPIFKARLQESGWWGHAWAIGRRIPDDIQPTLWMPLPEAPANG